MAPAHEFMPLLKTKNSNIIIAGLMLCVGFVAMKFFADRDVHFNNENKGGGKNLKVTRPPVASKDISHASFGAQNPVVVSDVDANIIEQYGKGVLRLLDMDGRLTNNAIQALGLSEDKALELQNIITKHRRLLANEAQRHLKVDAIRGTDVVSAFIVPPFPEQGAAIKKSLMQEAAALLGKDKGRAFELMFPRLNYGGDFGSLEIQIKVSESPAADTELGFGIVFETISPETGRPYGGGSLPISQINKQLGLNLEIRTE